MPQGTSRAEISHLRLAHGNPHSQVAISALTPDPVPNWLPTKTSKPLKPVSAYLGIEPLERITIPELDSNEHIVLARLSWAYMLYNVWLLITYLREK